jgi:hypothetical protein
LSGSARRVVEPIDGADEQLALIAGNVRRPCTLGERGVSVAAVFDLDDLFVDFVAGHPSNSARDHREEPDYRVACAHCT